MEYNSDYVNPSTMEVDVPNPLYEYAPPQKNIAYKFITFTVMRLMSKTEAYYESFYNITYLNEAFAQVCQLIETMKETLRRYRDLPKNLNGERSVQIEIFPYKSDEKKERFWLLKEDSNNGYIELFDILSRNAKAHQCFEDYDYIDKIFSIDRRTDSATRGGSGYDVTHGMMSEFIRYVTERKEFAPELFVNGKFDEKLRILDDLDRKGQGGIITRFFFVDRRFFPTSTRTNLRISTTHNDEKNFGFLAVLRDAIIQSSRYRHEPFEHITAESSML